MFEPTLTNLGEVRAWLRMFSIAVTYQEKNDDQKKNVNPKLSPMNQPSEIWKLPQRITGYIIDHKQNSGKSILKIAKLFAHPNVKKFLNVSGCRFYNLIQITQIVKLFFMLSQHQPFCNIYFFCPKENEYDLPQYTALCYLSDI